jgi:hypothetical protein
MGIVPDGQTDAHLAHPRARFTIRNASVDTRQRQRQRQRLSSRTEGKWPLIGSEQSDVRRINGTSLDSDVEAAQRGKGKREQREG